MLCPMICFILSKILFKNVKISHEHSINVLWLYISKFQFYDSPIRNVTNVLHNLTCNIVSRPTAYKKKKKKDSSHEWTTSHTKIIVGRILVQNLSLLKGFSCNSSFLFIRRYASPSKFILAAISLCSNSGRLAVGLSLLSQSMHVLHHQRSLVDMAIWVTLGILKHVLHYQRC